MRFYLINIILLLVFCACNTSGTGGGQNESLSVDRSPLLCDTLHKERLGSEDYIRYVEDKDNGLVAEKKISDFTFSLFYKPLEYQVLSNLKNANPLKADFDKEMLEAKDMQYFTFKVSVADFNEELLKYDLKSPEQYEQRVNYFAFKMQNDFKLIEGKDTLDCALFHFERNFGIAPNANFILAFPAVNNENKIYDKTLSFEDKTFGLGTININIDKTQIAKIPALNIE